MWPERRTAKLPHDAKLNLVWDGNSLARGYLGTPPADLVQAALQRMGRDVASVNVAVSGQTWRMMDGLDGGTAADVDGFYDPRRINVLVLWETTNAVAVTGRTPAQAAADAQAYLGHRLAAHPGWLPIVLTTLPRMNGTDQPTIDQVNANLLAADALVAAGYRAWGARALVDVRCPGSPFRFASFTPADFAREGQLWADQYVHLSSAGDQVIATMVTRAILALPPR